MQYAAETLLEWMEGNQKTLDDLPPSLQKIARKEAGVTSYTAGLLAIYTDIPRHIWINLQKSVDEETEKGK